MPKFCDSRKVDLQEAPDNSFFIPNAL